MDLFTLPFRKANPYHDARGRFASGPSSKAPKDARGSLVERVRHVSAAQVTYDPMKETAKYVRQVNAILAETVSLLNEVRSRPRMSKAEAHAMARALGVEIAASKSGKYAREMVEATLHEGAKFLRHLKATAGRVVAG